MAPPNELTPQHRDGDADLAVCQPTKMGFHNNRHRMNCVRAQVLTPSQSESWSRKLKVGRKEGEIWTAGLFS